MPLPSWSTDLPALDLLLSIAELGSVGRAAEAHCISQPTASSRISRLERQLGVQLLFRTRRGSSLTPAGEAVVAWAHDIISATNALADGVRSLRHDQHARLRVAASLTIAEYLLPAWLLLLRRTHPDLDVSAQVANSHDVTEAVRQGKVDLGFVEAPDVAHDLSRHAIGNDRVALVVASSNPLAQADKRRVLGRDLVDEALLIRESGSGTRDTFLRAMKNAVGATPVLPHAVTLGSTATILATARAGGGIGIVSARAAAAGVALGELVELEPRDLNLDRPLHAIWQVNKPVPLAAELLYIACVAQGVRGGSKAIK